MFVGVKQTRRGAVGARRLEVTHPRHADACLPLRRRGSPASTACFVDLSKVVGGPPSRAMTGVLTQRRAPRLFRSRLQVFLQTWHQLHQVAGAEAVVELMHQYVVPGILDRAGAAGQRE